MIRLLLETATEVCSVAVARDQTILAEHTALEAHQHSSHLTLFIQQVVREAGIKLTEVEEIVLSDGPGSYTSLRVGAATAKGLCLALPGVTLRVVPTLMALAVAGDQGGLVISTINSRRGEVYGQLWSGYDPETPPLNVQIAGEDPFAEILLAQGEFSVIVCGPGQDRFKDAAWLKQDNRLYDNLSYGAPQHCTARLLLAPAAPPEPVEGFAPNMSRLVDVATYEPFYLNPPFVTKSKKKLLGR
ncbi:MAG: tRNA (adenosine(37)-N6)-threonylcarbamoyltransferase complex dimerization subunit type 1 TsaB [Bacteroidota bacterium]